MSTTPVANGKKSSIRKILIILFGHLWVVEETYTVYKFLPSSSLSGVCSLILFKLFATGVTTQGELGAKFAAGVVDTGGKFATGVVDTGGAFATGVVDQCCGTVTIYYGSGSGSDF